VDPLSQSTGYTHQSRLTCKSRRLYLFATERFPFVIGPDYTMCEHQLRARETVAAYELLWMARRCATTAEARNRGAFPSITRGHF
jgi:hypothetical protein